MAEADCTCHSTDTPAYGKHVCHHCSIITITCLLTLLLFMVNSNALSNCGAFISTFLCVHVFMGHFISEGADLWSQPGSCVTLDKLFNLLGFQCLKLEN